MTLDNPRVIGSLGAASIIAGTMLGVGIMLTPPLVAGATHSPALFYGLWIFGALVALAGADAYAELGAALPADGGDVVYQDRAFGPAVAGASGVAMFALAFAGSIAALAAACGTWQVQTLLQAAGFAVDLSASVLGPITGSQLVALGIITIITALNGAGLRAATGVQAICTAVPVLSLAGLAVFALVTPAPAAVVAATPAAIPAAIPLLDAWSGVYFAYAGWPAAVYVAGSVRAPGRSLPRAMLGGTALITMLYLLLCAAFLHVLGWSGLASAGEAGTAFVQARLGPQAGTLMAGLILVALLASINGTALGGARVATALARRGVLPHRLVGAQAGSRAPHRALWVQAALAALLVLSGSFQSILSLCSLAMMLIGALTVLAQLRLRRQEPELARPYRALAHPWSAWLYLMTSGAMVVLSLRQAVIDHSATLPLLGVMGLLGLYGLQRLRPQPPQADDDAAGSV